MEHFQSNTTMERIIGWRHDEVTAVYHEKDLLNILLAMTHKLEKHMTGTSRTHKGVPNGTCMVLVSVFSLC